MYGTVINDDYFVFNVIGRGVYSTVWLAFKMSEREFVAIKIIQDNDRDVAMRELGVNLQLSKSEKLYILIDHFRLNENTCLVFPYFDGTLYDLFKHKPCPSNILEKIFNNMKEALTELHTKYNLIHGDIKPENIAFQFNNNTTNDIVYRFYNFASQVDGLDTCEIEQDGIENACRFIFDNIFTEEDKNLDDFVIYNSSNEDSEYNTDISVSEGSDDEEDSEEDSDEEGSDEEGNEEDSDGEGSDDEEGSDEEGDDEDGSEISDISDSQGSSSDRKSKFSQLGELTNDDIDNLTFTLIDYSHVHTPEEDLSYLPTRYYRTMESIKGEKCGYYKDWYALACTMYELEHGEIFANPTSDNKNEEQIQFITENFNKIEKWLVKN